MYTGILLGLGHLYVVIRHFKLKTILNNNLENKINLHVIITN